MRVYFYINGYVLWDRIFPRYLPTTTVYFMGALSARPPSCCRETKMKEEEKQQQQKQQERSPKKIWFNLKPSATQFSIYTVLFYLRPNWISDEAK